MSDEQSSLEVIHLWDDVGAGGLVYVQCDLAVRANYTFNMDKVTCIKCLWDVAKQGQLANDRLRQLQNLGQLVPQRT